jgi:hypothetical protein
VSNPFIGSAHPSDLAILYRPDGLAFRLPPPANRFFLTNELVF